MVAKIYILLSLFSCSFAVLLPPVIPIDEEGISFSLDSLIYPHLNLFPGETIRLRDGSITSIVRAVNATEHNILSDEDKAKPAFIAYQIQVGKTYEGSESPEENFQTFKSNILKTVEANLKNIFDLN